MLKDKMLQDKYQRYFQEYNDYSSKCLLGNHYLKLGQKVAKTSYCQVLYYQGFKENNKRNFLVIPSIFNSPEILLLSNSKSFIDNLRQYGDVFLVDWFELNEANYLLEDYVIRIIEIIEKLKQKNISTIDLIGHCIGGNLAIAAAVILPASINTITLLSTAWDFSHFSLPYAIYQSLGWDRHVQNLPMIPKLYIQMLFFLLFPNQFNDKLDKFFAIQSAEEKDLAFRIENWLLSGLALPKGTYEQIMNDIIRDNMLVQLQWKVNNIIIDPSLIMKPVYQIAANNDKIVPKSSILALHKLLKKPTLFEVEGGHISYLINNNISSLFERFN